MKKLFFSIKNTNTFKTEVYTKNLEKAYELAYERYHQNLIPEDIYIK